MNLLFIGDISGRPGRRILQKELPLLKEEFGVDLVVANCENAAGGFGITEDIVQELLSFGIKVLTSGNHIWDKKETAEFIGRYRQLIRPANYPPGNPGNGWTIYDHPMAKVGVINLVGRTFMPPFDCPFRVGEELVEKIRKTTPIIIVDFHGEATSEKKALGWFLDGKVTAVIGTHTHVQTADEQLLNYGTAYITDAGMTGAKDSVLGIRPELIIDRFLTGMPGRFEVAKGLAQLCGVVISIDENSGKALKITRVQRSETVE